MIATTIEQSKRLLELGLDPATADMLWVSPFKGERYIISIDDGAAAAQKGFTPSWSLDMMVEIMCADERTEVKFGKDIQMGWICSWVQRGETLKALNRVSETKVGAAFLALMFLLEQGYIKKGGEQ